MGPKDLVKSYRCDRSSCGFNRTNWENRSIVEVTGPVKSNGWFLHAITAETWLLKLKFRVPRRAFSKEQLLKVLSLPTLNEVPEIESYGNQSRVRASQTGTWMELEIHAFTLAEMDQPSFWQWLSAAMDAFLAQPIHCHPPQLRISIKFCHGKHSCKWHMQRKGFPADEKSIGHRTFWENVVRIVEQTAPGFGNGMKKARSLLLPGQSKLGDLTYQAP